MVLSHTRAHLGTSLHPWQMLPSPSSTTPWGWNCQHLFQQAHQVFFKVKWQIYHSLSIFFTNLGFIKISLILFSPGSFFVINLLYVYRCVLPACSSVHHLHAWCTQRPEESVRPTGTGMALGCEPPCVWNQVLWKSWQVLLTDEAFLQPRMSFFLKMC